MESTKQTYKQFLEVSETFNDWLKQVPFGFWIQSIKVNDDNSVTFIFKNSLDNIKHADVAYMYFCYLYSFLPNS